MTSNSYVQVSDLIHGLTIALDLVNPSLVSHHRQVFGFASKLTEVVDISQEEKSNTRIAAILHDIGVVAFNRHLNLDFDDTSVNDHAELGYRLIKSYKPFKGAAEIVRNHHSYGYGCTGDAPSIGSSIIHLADRVAVKMDANRCVLSQADEITRWVTSESGGMFLPEVVDAFRQESAKEYFWLDAHFNTAPPSCCNSPCSLWNMSLDMDGLRGFSELFRMVIDYRSSHTAAHSRSVAHVAEALAKVVGFSGNGCAKIYVAGNLHDLGKLAVPASILDKAGALSESERALIKGHSYHTYRVLKEVVGLDDICTWAACHHECLDGSGYPFRLCDEEIPLGARIIAVADVFTALSETRFYRNGLKKEDCLRIMEGMATARKLDPLLISLIEKHYDDFYDLQLSVQQDGINEYRQMLQEAIPFMLQAVEDLDKGAEMPCQ